MINLAVIGTNWISEKFVEAAKDSNQFTLSAVYSRQIESADGFAKEHQAPDCNFYNNLEELGADKRVDAVYIASPNSLHCEQAILMMEHGKHVICEKPLASNIDEVTRMYSVAEKYNVVLFEAFKTEFLPNFEELKMSLASIGKVRSVHLSYCQYSSRYQKYLNGENPNTFNPLYSNGSIMDIGFYSVSTAVSLFGKPDKIQASAKLLDSGVDAHGTVILEYPNFIVSVQHSKVSDGNIASEIQGEDGVILIQDFSECTGFTIHKREVSPQTIHVEQEDNSMIYEAIAFAEQVRDGAMNYAYVQRSLEVSEVITEIRKQTGVIFPADK
ncbi:Gfo/Idh/MocA family protein [Vibrio algarum]|uniref:Gfo/Idh/MocA family oxidoreductase n=1 Tax=Vibrio algarum TaxID=3020714 RepID=A0ABT4YVA1_9VIBR|nr:Gfo/Idh/MocA family oxidoreductase [Vibrio sp. KJ40-1]MDB1125513.1 Gfo/Idh/MocA family oxidoreductase [Vibrio sp. KJ40-1]